MVNTQEGPPPPIILHKGAIFLSQKDSLSECPIIPPPPSTAKKWIFVRPSCDVVRVKMKAVAFYSGRLQRVSDAPCLHQSLPFSCPRRLSAIFVPQNRTENTNTNVNTNKNTNTYAPIGYLPYLYCERGLQIQIQMPQKGICHICTAEQNRKHKYKCKYKWKYKYKCPNGVSTIFVL